MPEELKFSIIEELKVHVQNAGLKANFLDGIRVSEKDGWWLIRASNTQNCLIVRLEAVDDIGLQKLKERFKQLLIKSEHSAILLKNVDI